MRDKERKVIIVSTVRLEWKSFSNKMNKMVEKVIFLLDIIIRVFI